VGSKTETASMFVEDRH